MAIIDDDHRLVRHSQFTAGLAAFDATIATAAQDAAEAVAPLVAQQAAAEAVALVGADVQASAQAAIDAANLVNAPAGTAVDAAAQPGGAAYDSIQRAAVTGTEALYVPASLAFIPIPHGDNADYPRTAGPGSRLWVGSVRPNALLEGVDLWAQPVPVPPPVPPTIDTTNLVARWAARDLELADGTAVTSWPVMEGSATGAGFTIAGSPTHRIDGVVEYVETDGVDDALSYVSPRSQPSTTILVAKTFALTSGLTLFGSTSGSTALSTVGITSGNFVAYAGANIVGPAADYGWHVFSVVYNGASSVLRIDGVQVATGNPGTNTSGGIRHGGNSTLSAFSRVGVSESIHYTGAKTAGELAAIEAALMGAYGIA